MRLLLIVPSYPHAALPYSGAFNERSALALQRLGASVQVLAPRPCVPPLLARAHARWRAYGEIPAAEIKNGVAVARPRAPVVPRLAPGFWQDRAAFACLSNAARRLHRRGRFEAILSFDLVGAGGIAWRTARLLGIPAAGWATGGDVRFAQSSALGKVARRALANLPLVFYQSRELRALGAALLGVAPEALDAARHRVLPRGIAAPPELDHSAARAQRRAELGVGATDLLVLSIGRLSREKGIYELLRACRVALAQNRALAFRLIGAAPSFDESKSVQREIAALDHGGRVAALPACPPQTIWEYLCAADIFAFASHQEGMPNSLLEALAMALPAAAFAIPAVSEIDGGAGALRAVAPFDADAFAAALLELAASDEQRRALGARGRRRVLESFLIDHSMGEALAALTRLRAAAPAPAAASAGAWTGSSL